MLKSLRWKLVMMAVALVLATVIPLLFTTTWMMEETVKKKHEEQVEQEATALIHLIESYYDGFRQNLEMFSHSPLLEDGGGLAHKFIPVPGRHSHGGESQHGSDKDKREHDSDHEGKEHGSDKDQPGHDSDHEGKEHGSDKDQPGHDSDHEGEAHGSDKDQSGHDSGDEGGQHGSTGGHSHGQGLHQHIYEKFKEFGKTHDGAAFTFFGTRHGGLISYPQDTRTDFDPRRRSWYKEAIADQGRVIRTAPRLDEATQKRVISLAQVVPGKDGEITGVAAFDISNDFLEQTVKKVKVGKSGYVVLLDKNGTVVVDARHPDNNMKKLSETAFAGSLASGKEREEGEADHSVELDGTEYHVHSVTSAGSGWTVMVFIDHQELRAAAVKVRNRLLGIAAVVVLVVSLFSLLVASRLLAPIKGMMRDLAAFEGDLTMRFQVKSRDEIGQLAKWFNVFLEKLQELLRGVQGETGSVSDSAAELSGIAATLLESAQGTSGRANTVAAAAEEMNVNITNVAATMEQSSSNISMVASAAEKMTGSINDIAGSVRSAAEISESGVEQAQQTSSRMGELDEAAQAISEVTDTITEISEQTNLLALNATIEAARAGEAGKGFAVVANEIKELARQTAEATGNIRDKINGVQQTSNASIGAINEIVSIINKINEIITGIATSIDEQSMTTREIAENINQASRGLTEVNGNISQSSVVAASISSEIAEVDVAAGRIVARGEELNSQSEVLKGLSDNLKKLVATFKI